MHHAPIHADSIESLADNPVFQTAFRPQSTLIPRLTTSLGMLFDGDCMDMFAALNDESVDTVFADPPFNIRKAYGERYSDDVDDEAYVLWCERWIDECIRVLKPGGSLFIYNLPKWNILLGAYCMRHGMSFRHDIAVEMKNHRPINGRLYLSHNSLLYFTKGNPGQFHRVRTPLQCCRHCKRELADYGGHRHKMNPAGVTLTDVWTDIPVVRHRKYKPTGRSANTLSTKLLDRVLDISTDVGDLVLDPFGGGGTTFAVAEKKGRYWIGAELNDAEVIVRRLTTDPRPHHPNTDRVDARPPR